jgi:hypothetical protein
MTTFDALHAGLAETRDACVLASEGDYDALEVGRVGLEGGWRRQVKRSRFVVRYF